ncbi:hypothetical protein GCM10020258_00820 [Sphingomonas yabuuchiae]
MVRVCSSIPSRLREGKRIWWRTVLSAGRYGLPPAGGRGWGGPFRKRALDGCNDALQIAQNVVVPEADDPPALRFEIVGSGFVVSFVFGMMAAIDFND